MKLFKLILKDNLFFIPINLERFHNKKKTNEQISQFIIILLANIRIICIRIYLFEASTKLKRKLGLFFSSLDYW